METQGEAEEGADGAGREGVFSAGVPSAMTGPLTPPVSHRGVIRADDRPPQRTWGVPAATTSAKADVHPFSFREFSPASILEGQFEPQGHRGYKLGEPQHGSSEYPPRPTDTGRGVTRVLVTPSSLATSA
jgi:hypothetical protein